MGRQGLGEFEHQVLLTVYRIGGESYSVPVVLELEKRTGKTVAQPAVYIAMTRLEKKGYLRSRLDDHAVAETGRVRRYFAVTPKGVQKLREVREMLGRLWAGVGRRLDEA